MGSKASVRTRELVFAESSSNKSWNIELKGGSLITEARMTEGQTQEPAALSEPASAERKCDLCGEAFDPQYSRDGQHCFVCSVHATCACADDPK